MADNIQYNAKFPNPPKFIGGPSRNSFGVPKYYGWDHPCTKWVLGSVGGGPALTRLLKVCAVHPTVLSRVHQVPDRPGLVLKERYNLDRPAFSAQAILYLTPLTLAIYTAGLDALSNLVTLRSSSGALLVDTTETCYVQNFWRKGQTDYFSDLFTTTPAVIAVRREFFAAFPYLLSAGYNPNASFSLTYRKPHREITIVYKDLIHYAIDYLKRRPAFNVGRLMHFLLQSTKDCINILDIYCFDILPLNKEKIVSLFQRVSTMALVEEYVSEENGMHILNVLEKIQEAGFFLGLPCIGNESLKSFISLKELLNNQSELKLRVFDLQNLSKKDRDLIMEKDYKFCVSNVILWLRARSLKRKTEQNVHLLNLLTKILFDTNYIEIFFKKESKSVEELCEKIYDFPNLRGKIDRRTVIIIRDHIIHVYCQSETMIIDFISKYKMEPKDILLGSEEALNILNNPNKSNWVKSELLDSTFRTKYLSEKSKEENKSNKFSDDDLELMSKNREFKNQNNAESKEDYYFVSKKTKCFRSSSTKNNNRCIKEKRKESVKSPDVTIESVASLYLHDRMDSISRSTLNDYNHLSLIEIDLTVENHKSNKMYSEVEVNEEDDLQDTRHSSVMSGMEVPIWFNCYKSLCKPPPLIMNRKENSSK